MIVKTRRRHRPDTPVPARCWWIAALLGCVLAGTALTAAAADVPTEFANQENEEQYKKLVRELRCTVCQSETIYESNAALAGDMRRRVYEMTADGASEEEIIDFMVQRYGEYVRYRPALTGSTILLWSGPFLLLLVGGLIWAQVVRQRRRMTATPDLTEEERAALERFRQGE